MFKQEIIDKKFSRAFQGYDVAEVDYFLDEVYRELSFRDREEAALQAQIEELSAELEKHRQAITVNGEDVEELYFLEDSTQECEQMEQIGEEQLESQSTNVRYSETVETEKQ